MRQSLETAPDDILYGELLSWEIEMIAERQVMTFTIELLGKKTRFRTTNSFVIRQVMAKHPPRAIFTAPPMIEVHVDRSPGHTPPGNVIHVSWSSRTFEMRESPIPKVSRAERAQIV